MLGATLLLLVAVAGAASGELYDAAADANRTMLGSAEFRRCDHGREVLSLFIESPVPFP
jgi:hypothetical protein